MCILKTIQYYYIMENNNSKKSLSDYLEITDGAHNQRRVTEFHADILDRIFDVF